MKQILKEIHETQKATKKEVFQELLDYAEAHELDFDLKRLLGKLGQFVATSTLDRSKDLKWLSKALLDKGDSLRSSNMHLIYKAENGDLVATNGVMMFIIKTGGRARDTFICPLTGIGMGKDVNTYTYPNYQSVLLSTDSVPYVDSGIKLGGTTLPDGTKLYEYSINGKAYGLPEKQVKAVFSGINPELAVVRFCPDTGRAQFECGRKVAIISPVSL